MILSCDARRVMEISFIEIRTKKWSWKCATARWQPLPMALYYKVNILCHRFSVIIIFHKYRSLGRHYNVFRRPFMYLCILFDPLFVSLAYIMWFRDIILIIIHFWDSKISKSNGIKLIWQTWFLEIDQNSIISILLSKIEIWKRRY